MTPVPRWAVYSTFALSLMGLAISTYLTITHFGGSNLLVCSGGSGVVDCGLVTTSAQSYFLGIPVAVLGLGQYVVMTALTTPMAWRREERWIHIGRFALAGIGVGFILWLIAAELLIINHICLWCTGVHVVTIALFFILAQVTPSRVGWITSPEEESDAPLH